MRTPLKHVGIALLVAVGACGVLIAGSALWVSSQARDRQPAAADAPARDVGIVFAAQVYDDGRLAPFTSARVDLAIRLYEAGRVKVLVMSGNNTDEHNNETTNMRRYAVARGVPDDRIVEDPAGNDTYDTCIRARDVYGVRTATLISQSYHLPRAIAACRALGVDAIGVGDDSVRNRDFWPIGVAREFPANVKLVKDVALRRPPEVASPPSDAVARALGA